MVRIDSGACSTSYRSSKSTARSLRLVLGFVPALSLIATKNCSHKEFSCEFNFIQRLGVIRRDTTVHTAWPNSAERQIRKFVFKSPLLVPPWGEGLSLCHLYPWKAQTFTFFLFSSHPSPFISSYHFLSGESSKFLSVFMGSGSHLLPVVSWTHSPWFWWWEIQAQRLAVEEELWVFLSSQIHPIDFLKHTDGCNIRYQFNWIPSVTTVLLQLLWLPPISTVTYWALIGCSILRLSFHVLITTMPLSMYYPHFTV